MVSSLIVTIILISVLVIAHEFGHFIVAKKSGICVQEFRRVWGQSWFPV